MKISKRVLFFLCIVFISELGAMMTNKPVSAEVTKELEPLFAKILGIDSDFQKIGRISYGGTRSFLQNNQKSIGQNERLLLNNTEAKYVARVSDGMSNMPVYYVTVVQNKEVVANYTIVDARLLDRALGEESKIEAIKAPLRDEIEALRKEKEKTIDSMRTQVEVLQKQNTAFEDKWKNRSLIEKHPYIFCGLGILAGGLLVAFGLTMQQGRLELALLKN